jgi:hypothetical protein
MKEALKLALEALETCEDDEWHTDEDFGMVQIYDTDKVNQAITAIKEALAQPPEPRNFCPRCGKRTADLTVIHTCTPPEGGHQ